MCIFFLLKYEVGAEVEGPAILILPRAAKCLRPGLAARKTKSRLVVVISRLTVISVRQLQLEPIQSDDDASRQRHEEEQPENPAGR